MPSYKLIYFNVRARAEATRMLFGLGGVEYEDKRVSFADWPALKPNTPWGALPLLEVDGKQLGQSMAIARYVAKQVGMAGKTPIEAGLVDSVVDSVSEIMDKFYPVMMIKDEAEKNEKKKEFEEKTLKPISGNLEKFFSNNQDGKGFFVGNSMTFADVHFFTAFEYIKGLFPDIFTKAVKLGGLFERMAKDAKVAAYIKNRPASDF